MARFKQKVAIVTGASGGIGAAIAERLGREQANLVLAVRDPAQTEGAVRGALWAGAPAVSVVKCDVSVESEVAAACAAAVAQHGGLDVIINNAGLMTFSEVRDLDEAGWLEVLKVDLLGCAYFIKHGFRTMRSGGAIVNIASIHALQTTANAGAYAAAKAGAVSLTRTASIEGSALGLRVNAVLPGAIDTPMLWDNPNVKSGAEALDKTQIGRPEDVAAAAAFLASNDARFINGASLVVDGGRLARL